MGREFGRAGEQGLDRGARTASSNSGARAELGRQQTVVRGTFGGELENGESARERESSGRERGKGLGLL
jgi:hypothetical protein